MFSIIAAVDNNNGIGKHNHIPWVNTPEYKEDIKNFKQITTSYDKNEPNVVIMGRKTFESIGVPLPNRVNVVITKTKIDNVTTYSDLSTALSYLYSLCYQNIFVIGGEQLYKEAIARFDCEKIYLTKIDSNYECDRYFPTIDVKYYYIADIIDKLNTYYIYQQRKNMEYGEKQYLDLIEKVLDNGYIKDNRTAIPTRSLFGHQIRFDISKGVLPLLTTKKTFYRGIVEELLFFIRGDHDNRKLKAKNVHIWDGNTSREYLDKYGKEHIETDDLSLSYGVQWRSAGAKKESIDTDYRGKGVDQLSNVINLLKTDKNSRRIILNAWNPEYLNDMALVPCHIMYQFYVCDNKLSCMMTQRSADLFLGLPFNIASTATLTHLLAKVCNLDPGEIIINLGDAHIYKNHIDQVELQLSRTPYHFPTLNINKELNTIEDLENLEWEDFEVRDYYSHGRIKADMVV